MQCLIGGGIPHTCCLHSDRTPTLPIQYIPQLNVTGYATSLLWLQSSNIKYYAPVEDPWFKATSPRAVPSFLEPVFSITLPDDRYYVADGPARVLGCTTAVNFCSSASSGERHCYEPGVKGHSLADVWPKQNDQVVMRGYVQFLTYMFDGTANDPQVYCKNHTSASENTTDSILHTADTTTGLPSLKTRFTLRGLMQPATIPANRWQEEMEYIFQTNLAATQARLVEYASGELPSNIEAYRTSCGSQIECKRVCNTQVCFQCSGNADLTFTKHSSQRMRSPAFYSFSVLGLFVLLSLGAFLILIGMLMESIVNLLAKIPRLAQSRRFTYARIEWQFGSTIQLQRLAHESVGSGTWSAAGSATPVTRSGEKLAAFDISDPQRPRLVMDGELKSRQTVLDQELTTWEEGDVKTPQQTIFGVERTPKYQRLSKTDSV